MLTIKSFCLRFPETRKLNLGQTLSSGHGSVSFDSDQDCTDFVHSFFPDCKPYLSSCSQVQKFFKVRIFSLLRWRRVRSQRCWFWVASSATTPPSWLPCFQKSRIITLCNSRGDPSYIVIRVTNRCHFLLERSCSWLVLSYAMKAEALGRLCGCRSWWSSISLVDHLVQTKHIK